MKALSAIWARIGLTTRLSIASGLATCLALIVATTLSTTLASRQAQQQLDVELQQQLDFLSRAISTSLLLPRQQNINRLLNQTLQLPGITAVGYRSMVDATAFEKNAPQTLTAPTWFFHLCGLSERQGTRPIMIDGHLVGHASLTVSPFPAINDAWRFLVQQFYILIAGASIVFVGVWLALRSNLKPFAALINGSNAIGRGDFSQRMHLVGSREFRDAFAAFNVMADNLEGLVNALRRSEHAFVTLVEAAPVGVVRLDQRGNLVFANNAIRHLSGMTGGGVTANDWLAQVHPDDRARLTAYWAQVRSGEIPDNFIHRYLWSDGSIVWVQVRVALLHDSAANSSDVVAIINDITAERELQNKGERLSRLYATLSQINSAIVHAADTDSLYSEVCRIVVDVGGFSGASVRKADWIQRKAILVASAGAWKNILGERVASLDMDMPESTPAATLALQAGLPMTANDFANDERFSRRFREQFGAVGAGSMSTMPFRQSGQVIGVLGIMSHERNFFSDDMLALIEEIGRDISFALDNFALAEQKRQTEQLLVHNEENLRVTLNSIGDAVLATDTNGCVTMLNPVAETLTGWPEADALGKPVSEVFRIINQDTRAIVESPVDIVLRDGAIVGLANHTLLIARDGTERPIADSGAPIRYSGAGEIRGVVLVFRDQSEDYRMLKALTESEKLYSSLVKTVPVGVLQTDMEGNATYGNATMRKIAGLDSDRVSKDEWLLPLHPDDRDRVAATWAQATESRSTVTAVYRYVHADGSIIWARTTLAPVLNDQSEITGFIGAVVDITSEQQHLRRIEQLSSLYATLSQVNSAIVHCDDERELYSEVARTFVDVGGFEIATLIEVDHEKPGWAKAITRYFRVEDEFSRKILDVFAGKAEISGVSARAIATGNCELSNDYQNDDTINQAWRDNARLLGIASTTAIPFVCFGQVMAILALSSSEKSFFSQDIVALLEEIGRNVSHELENITREQKRAKAEDALARNEERLRLGLSVTKTGMYEVDFTKGRVTLDAVSTQLMNLGDGVLNEDIDTFLNMLPEKNRKNMHRAREEILNGTIDSYATDVSLLQPDGTNRWLRNRGALTAERTPQGSPSRLLGMITDISATKKLEERDHLAATVFDHSGEAIIIANINQDVILVNQAFTRISGFSASEILGAPIAPLYRSDRHDQKFYTNIVDSLKRDGVWQGEIWRKRKNGEVFPTLTALSLVKDKHGVITHYVEQQTDISKQKAFEARISELAYRDALTALPNRTLLRDRVEQSLALAHREGSTVALLFLDLDHFKNINDSLGHSVGDRLLKEVAQRLTGAVREVDTVGRLGGDEFLIVLPDTNAEAAAHVAQKLLTESARPLIFESHSLVVTPSVGIALYPKDGVTFDELLTTADTAMYRAKDEGRNAYRFYTPEMNQAVFQRMVLESSLRRAIEQNEFVLYYQPKFELHGQMLIGVEALIRWHQPEMGMISPAQFIPVAEESGLIEAIGTWVLEEACRQVKAWQDEGLPLLRVAVNFSARQFAARNIAELVSTTLEKAGISGAGLEIEITESLLAQDMDYTLEVLQSLKKLGVHIAVDDFGTGYSSLSYLKRFPIDRLKIDQSFVRDLVKDPDDRAIATAIVTLGHSLGIRVIAEGVETSSQLEILRTMGCDEVQGYYLGRPTPAAEMTNTLRKLATTTNPGA